MKNTLLSPRTIPKKLFFHLNIQRNKLSGYRKIKSDKNMPVIHVSVYMRGIVEESAVGMHEDDWSKLEKTAERVEIMKYTRFLKSCKKMRWILGFGMLLR